MGKGTLEFCIEVVVEPDEGGFHAFCPALEGLHVDGVTEEEALSNVRDAAIAYLHSLIKHGDPIPVGVVVAGVVSRLPDTHPAGSHRHVENLRVPYAYA